MSLTRLKFISVAGFLALICLLLLRAAFGAPAVDPGESPPVIGEAAVSDEPAPAEPDPALTLEQSLFMPLVIQPPPIFFTPWESDVLALANAERAKAGCNPLRPDPTLRAAAYLHSKDMGDYGYFSHTGRDGSSFSTRARRAGYTGSPRGENIAAGYASPTSVMQAWMNSSGHRANILNCSSTSLGVGYYNAGKGYGHYWTQVFGRD